MRIKELRNELNLTQSDLAKAIDTSQRNIGRWENGENEPTSSSLTALANFFKCSIDYLLGRSDDFGSIVLPSSPVGEQLTQEEKELIEAYRALSLKNKMHVSAYVTVRLEEQQAEMHKGRS